MAPLSRIFNVSAISGDIQSLLTEGNALCGQLKSLAAELGSTPSGVSAETPEAAPLPGSSAEVAEEPPFPPVPSRSAENPLGILLSGSRSR